MLPEVAVVNLHKTDFKTPPFFKLDAWTDSLNQAVPDGLAQSQPKLGMNSFIWLDDLSSHDFVEYFLRKAVNDSPYCDLRVGCKAVSRVETSAHVILTYEKSNNIQERINCSYLIGADGKKGIVRKHFLEPTTDIRQQVGLSEYTGTWIAANLKIHLPTPETHPNFPLWEINLSPEEVYDLFWPKGWHFCTPPGKATASGRFGPPKERLWRHEFAEPGIIGDRAEDLLWEHLTPMITRTHYSFPTGPITFPRDCIEVKRCRPFTFEQKVVNTWFTTIHF
jgi:hypothetical protein